MQLREYASILRRYWLIIVALPLLVAAISAVAALNQPQQYVATARVLVTRQLASQAPSIVLPDMNLNYSWLTSEYILDDVPQVISSNVFATDVAKSMAAEGYTSDPETVRAGLQAEVLHRAVSLRAVADTPDLPPAMLRGTIAALKANGLHYWDRALDEQNSLRVAIIDPPSAAAPTNSRRAMLVDVALRTGLALVAAVGLAFLLHYLDDRLRSERQTEQATGLHVLGVIPKE